jgi:hypothetical protein
MLKSRSEVHKMTEPIIYHISDEQQQKLNHIGKQLAREPYDLITSSIDEAILDWERSSGEIKLKSDKFINGILYCAHCDVMEDATKIFGGHKGDCSNRIPF